jgi:hypothetical protein
MGLGLFGVLRKFGIFNLLFLHMLIIHVYGVNVVIWYIYAMYNDHIVAISISVTSDIYNIVCVCVCLCVCILVIFQLVSSSYL